MEPAILSQTSDAILACDLVFSYSRPWIRNKTAVVASVAELAGHVIPLSLGQM
jgi:hypothetical protein